MEIRTCKVCSVPKPLEEFATYKSKKGPYRLRTCIPCQREKDRLRAREYQEKNREEINRRARIDKRIRYDTDPEFREKVKARSREAGRKYYQKNRERILAQRKERRKAAS